MMLGLEKVRLIRLLGQYVQLDRLVTVVGNLDRVANDMVTESRCPLYTQKAAHLRLVSSTSDNQQEIVTKEE